MTEDPKLSKRYRELSREEPSRAIDEAILAAARREAETRPAPLVVPSGRRRWYFPLAAAAIIVLAVAVTIHVEREQPDSELAIPPVTAPKVLTDERTVPSGRALDEVKPAAKPELRAQREAAPAEAQAIPAPAPAPPAAPAPQARPAPGLRADQRALLSREAEVTSALGAKAKFAHASPEQWLQGIADLRRQGRHDEADKALAEFRKRYPDYRIPEAMLEKVESR